MPHWTTLVATEAGLAIGAALTLGGMLLHVRLARQQMSIEERVKDGRLTEAQALIKIRIWAVAAPTLTLLGAFVLILGLSGYLR